MPRYTTVTPQFNPVDYATRIKPLEQYKEEYDKRADALDEQAVLADAIGGLIDPEKDGELADIYNQFNNQMQSVVSDLMQTGDLTGTRRGLSQLRSAYANQLVPIKTAYEDRAKEAEEYRKKKLNDDTYIGTDPMSHSLSDYYKGRRPNDKGISGASLYTMAMEDAKTASGREFRETAWRLDKNLGNQFFTKIEREGWTQDEVMAALSLMAGSEDKSISEDARKLMKYIGDTTARIHDLRGVQDLNDAQKIKEADGYILEGILSGIGYKQTGDKAAYNPSLWLDYQIKQKQLEGKDNQQNVALPYDSRPTFIINGKKKDETEYMKLLSDLQLGNKTLDTVISMNTGGFESPTRVGDTGPRSLAAQNNFGAVTVADQLYDLSKGLGLINKDTPKETFISQLKRANASEFDEMLNTMAVEIKKNAQRYSEYFTNVTNASKINQHVNDSNSNASDENSVIRDAKDKPISRLPHEEHGTYYLPTQESEGKKGIRYAAEDGKNYYVRPSAFQGTVAYSKDGTALSMKQAMNAYYNALSQKDDAEARRLGQTITAFLAQYTIDRMPVQGDTSKEALPSIP